MARVGCWPGMASALSPAGSLAWTCPDCRRPLVATGGCVVCLACGHSPCG